MRSITGPGRRFWTIASLGLTLAGPGCGAPADTPTAPPAIRPPAAQTPPAESVASPTARQALTVWRPASGSLVTTPVRIEGQATQMSGAVSAIVRDDQGKELGRGSTSLAAGDPSPVAFSFDVPFSLITGSPPAAVEVFTLNATDGSVQQRTRIPVRFER